MKEKTKVIVQMIAEIATEAESLRPAARSIVDALKTFGPEIGELLDEGGDFLVDRRARSVKRFMEEHGFTKEEAITLTLDVESRIEKGIRRAGGKSIRRAGGK